MLITVILSLLGCSILNTHGVDEVEPVAKSLSTSDCGAIAKFLESEVVTISEAGTLPIPKAMKYDYVTGGCFLGKTENGITSGNWVYFVDTAIYRVNLWDDYEDSSDLASYIWETPNGTLAVRFTVENDRAVPVPIEE